MLAYGSNALERRWVMPLGRRHSTPPVVFILGSGRVG